MPRSVKSPESPGKRPQNWEPGVARPRASCGSSSSSEDWGGDLGTTRVAWLRSADPRREKGGMSSPGPPWALIPLGAPQRQPNASTGAIPQPQLPSPRRARTSSADPAPQPLTGKAEPRTLSFSFVSRVTRTGTQGYRRRSPLPPPLSLPGDRPGLLETNRGRSACRGPQLLSEGSRTHPAEMAKFKLPSPNVLEKPGV